MYDQKTDSSFLSVINAWPEYFESMDEGLGTTYERFILHRYFTDIKQKYQISSVLETPSFGMTGVSGINSLWWSQQGIKPVVVDADEERIKLSEQVWSSIPLDVKFQYTQDLTKFSFDNKSFDLTWNFASLWFVDDLEKFAQELQRVTRKVIFICVPNVYGIGYKLREYYNEIPNGLHPTHIRPKLIRRLFESDNWKTWKSGYLDIPPWPDIAMKKEDLFPKIGLGFLIKNKTSADESQRTCIVDFFNGSRPDLEKDILKYSFLEKSPFPVKQIWAHHRYFIFVKS